ncbi:hypothetical protein BLNAU_2908 [Blattamonas nauphoetae]|uniref:Uncharacterized protein n=1 Tax=Blattamonas nauphoetae TaxID=2049346 RepID=A0ABQ9YER8_9EUKA|nr:hypothetical protein BLNAU_2908 [Blattamonas nauphoetae]
MEVDIPSDELPPQTIWQCSLPSFAEQLLSLPDYDCVIPPKLTVKQGTKKEILKLMNIIITQRKINEERANALRKAHDLRKQPRIPQKNDIPMNPPPHEYQCEFLPLNASLPETQSEEPAFWIDILPNSTAEFPMIREEEMFTLFGVSKGMYYQDVYGKWRSEHHRIP